jgi:hypothetical protein
MISFVVGSNLHGDFSMAKTISPKFNTAARPTPPNSGSPKIPSVIKYHKPAMNGPPPPRGFPPSGLGMSGPKKIAPAVAKRPSVSFNKAAAKPLAPTFNKAAAKSTKPAFNKAAAKSAAPSGNKTPPKALTPTFNKASRGR